MNFPPHIANAPTPHTDKLGKILVYSTPVTCADTLFEHAQNIERQLLYLTEVVEKLAERLSASENPYLLRVAI